ncbi:TspO/MBR family protein [Flavobacterium sp.]|uniref:TspO/MBR family protein n=1 Tax=Flavobacterium sp. TaxID=239 RepID=UPI00286B2B1C|nr:TspO/MBR family protein [Flavobacterium sp.]
MIEKNTLSPQWKLFICIVICQAIGIISGLIAATNNNVWFESLQKPSWNPPGYLFGPVWTFLYLLMSISLWIVWKSNMNEKIKDQATLIFALQLFLNFWWSILFFKFQSPLFAFIDIIFMIILIFISISRFSKFSKLAAWLLVPYISWVCFAAILNYKIMVLNN